MRSLLAGLFAVLSVLAAVPAAEAHPRHARGAEQCAVSGEDMEMILIRRGPATYEQADERVYPGDCGIMLTGSCRHDWCPVRHGPFRGWMRAHNLRAVSPPVYCVDRVAFGGTLELWSLPSHHSNIVVSVSADFCGIQLLAGEVGHWRHIRAHGFEGWVSASSLRLDD